MPEAALGIDIGGSGIKGAVVDVVRGEFLSDRKRIATPEPATRDAVIATVADLVSHFEWTGPLGIAFPGVVQSGTARTAANLHQSLFGADVAGLVGRATGLNCTVRNDADTAGLAEMRFGHGRDLKGVTLFVTIGTGLGTALFVDGRLVPNTEFGHSYMKNGSIAEHHAGERVRTRNDLSWPEWGKRFAEALAEMCKITWPETILLGGGSSRKFDKFASAFDDFPVEVRPAKLLNKAGIIGAAVDAAEGVHSGSMGARK